ncbi:MAG: hypothetical protein KDB72_21005 [Mycobacterium sp.]|nr:hypothetical protein [Mycobacterium sp.]
MTHHTAAELRARADRLRAEADRLDRKAQTLARTEFESALLEVRRADAEQRRAEVRAADAKALLDDACKIIETLNVPDALPRSSVKALVADASGKARLVYEDDDAPRDLFNLAHELLVELDRFGY